MRVNAIAPGFVDTPLLRASMPAKFITGVVEDRMPLGRMAAPEEIEQPEPTIAENLSRATAD